MSIPFGWLSTPIFEFGVETDIVLMQFTGLKDKNGKEIYEGDIVRLNNSELVERKGVVIFNDYNAAFLVRHENLSMTTLNYAPLEVIGNIYEHPELMK